MNVCAAALRYFEGKFRVLEKVIPNQEETIGYKKVEVRAEEHSSKKSGGIKLFTQNSQPFYQASSLEDYEKSDMIESYLHLQKGSSSDLLQSQQIQRDVKKVAVKQMTKEQLQEQMSRMSLFPEDGIKEEEKEAQNEDR